MKNFKDKIGSKYTTKRTKLQHFKKISPEPPYQSAWLCHAQIFKYEKKYSWPLLPNPGYAHDIDLYTYWVVVDNISLQLL